MNNFVKVSILATSVLIFSGCGAKHYKENQVYGSGVNRHYEFDIIEQDRRIIHSIQRNNAEFFNQRLQWGINKMVEALTAERKFKTTASDKAQNHLQSQTPREISQDNFSVLKDKDRTKNHTIYNNNTGVKGQVIKGKKDLFKDIANDKK